MYKPDPRLPPDQQMLPTHAKRLAQEGGVDVKTLDINDGAYTPVLDTEQHTLEPPNAEKQRRLSPNGGSPTKSTHSQDTSAWPLGAGNATNEPSSPRPGTSGGYRITPVIASHPAPQKNSTSEKDMTEPHNPTPRVPDFDKDEEELPKKKGCMGCVVM